MAEPMPLRITLCLFLFSLVFKYPVDINSEVLPHETHS